MKSVVLLEVALNGIIRGAIPSVALDIIGLALVIMLSQIVT